MELYKEILINVLSVTVDFPMLQLDAERLMEKECYVALEKIKAIIHDDSLADNECFTQIEQIVDLFEQLGSTCGGRHDFG